MSKHAISGRWFPGVILATLTAGILGRPVLADALAAQAQHPTLGATPATAVTASRASVLVFKGVTVIDVTDGRLLSDQTVVVVDSRVQAVGPSDKVRVPSGAQVVDGRGKYLIPGLWDMHVHVDLADAQTSYRLLVANGVTGIREAGTSIPLDTLLRWRREIAAGARLGPPRQIFAGPSLKGRRKAPRTPEEAQFVVDSLKAAGADFIKMRAIPSNIYFAVAAQARRVGLSVGGHLPHLEPAATPIEASDSGATIVDHPYGMEACMGQRPSVAECTPIAERFKHNGTWFVPTLLYHMFGASGPLPARLRLDTLQRSGMPILAGTDAHGTKIVPGPTLHQELALFVEGGLTPLAALQAATLNPAKLMKATDSLGTVAPGKLADLVLLDADPLADITNTTKIRAVVANGRYFDRAVLDTLAQQAAAEGSNSVGNSPKISNP